MPHRRLKRKACVLVLLLLAGGAIVNVAVAWGCAFNIDFTEDLSKNTASSSTKDSNADKPFWVLMQTIPRLGARRVVSLPWVFSRSKAPSTVVSPQYWSRTANPPTESDIQTFSGWTEDARGFPMLATYCYWQADANGICVNEQVRYGIPLEQRKVHPITQETDLRAIPLYPIWPGFAINTIFYAAILALLFYGPGKVWRFVRVKRGRCPACGYIIALGTCASGVCSECGATLPKRLVRPRSA
jgi:hypothetical protein